MRHVFIPLFVAMPAAAEEAVKIAVIPTQLEASAKGSVPSLFDDYLLTAVQNTSRAQVIGQDDIGAMLGFEKQKDIMNCDDTACMADIGGALGVDKIVAVKIARLGEDWVATAKLINIKATKVEARVNEIVPGDTKALLKAVPSLIANLFGAAVAPSAEPAAPAAKAAVPREDRDADAADPDSKLGRGARIGGTVLLFVGPGLAFLGGLLATDPGCSYDYYSGECVEDTSSVFLGAVMVIAGIVSSGVGAKVRANGVARRDLGNPSASGRPAVYWLGWVLGGVAMAMPILGLAEVLDSGATTALGWIGGLGALATFILGGTVGVRTSYGALEVAPTVGIARTAGGESAPTLGFGVRF